MCLNVGHQIDLHQCFPALALKAHSQGHFSAFFAFAHLLLQGSGNEAMIGIKCVGNREDLKICRTIAVAHVFGRSVKNK